MEATNLNTRSSKSAVVYWSPHYMLPQATQLVQHVREILFVTTETKTRDDRLIQNSKAGFFEFSGTKESLKSTRRAPYCS